jgi:methanogenic corrinoid protein MtbC1
MKTTLEVFRTAGIRGRIKVMIGGAPITQSYADSIGADAYGENAAAAVAIARKLAGG